jgi:hypothetical protein
VLSEGTVIVVGILIALAADAWWDGRVERRDEMDALLELQAEFEDNAIQLDSVLSHHAAGQAAAEVLLSFSRAEAELSADSVRELIWSLDNPWTYNPKSGALDALIASGRLGIIRDRTLRAELAGWSGLVEDYREEEDHARAYAMGPQYEYFASVLNWSALYGADRGQAPASLLRLVGDPGLQSVVAYRASFLEGVVTEAQYIVEALERIQQRLAANLPQEVRE